MLPARSILFWIACLFLSPLAAEQKISILAYHRFGPNAPERMTVSNRVFETHLKWLQQHGYAVIPMERAVKFLRGEEEIPLKSVVITVDDGHKSVYTDMAPLIRKYRVPVTLFIYPSAISNAKYAMTWDQLRELEATKYFSVESHTYWHPNFKIEKRRLPPAEYEKLVAGQLGLSKSVLEKEMGHEVKYLAWAFGIHDLYLEAIAKKCGYTAAFSIGRRPASAEEGMLGQPRFLMQNGDDAARFETIVFNAN
ncbi:MAG: polysaccharide deacetylase family protein [Sulfuricurvum sp.]|jgi:peptidoglycan/xylan/chitin deacetylase (PgdA/CDA1 family)|uniref:polysaccharide deacetylase family protein n=1 Tax=Sulfuricurvum sp. TaxID=2025608 RepID=UPI0025FCD6E4|nr:polysaccharide deacetylase family protein [Sulfuricurvum sp.]MCK9373763.1 polysaccharide deacetylase family protein [Sulfuricurvum sp.]